MIYRTPVFDSNQLRILQALLRVNLILETEILIRNSRSSSDTALDVINIGDQFQQLLNPIRIWRLQLQEHEKEEIQTVMLPEMLDILRVYLGRDYNPVAGLAPVLQELFSEIQAGIPDLRKALDDAGVYDPDVEDSKPVLSGRASTELN